MNILTDEQKYIDNYDNSEYLKSSFDMTSWDIGLFFNFNYKTQFGLSLQGSIITNFLNWIAFY